MILTSEKAKIIIIFPQNISFQYSYTYPTAKNTKEYVKSIRLKNHISHIENNMLKFFMPPNHGLLQYQNVVTTIKNQEIESDFCFKNVLDNQIVTRSKKSNMITTIKFEEDYYFSTLNIMKSKEIIKDFLKEIGLISDKIELPDWVIDYNFFDDEEQKETANQLKNEINELEQKLRSAQEILNKNNEHKSILVTNADELVFVTFKILEDMLNCDLSEFEDKKREDFIIKKENITFIGEIKGVTSNVNDRHISQLEVHYRNYLDELTEKITSEDVKAILIMNTERTKPINERQPVHENQIQLAERNKSLIITTEVFLKLYEKFLQGEINSDNIIELFKNNIGLLVDI